MTDHAPTTSTDPADVARFHAVRGVLSRWLGFYAGEAAHAILATPAFTDHDPPTADAFAAGAFYAFVAASTGTTLHDVTEDDLHAALQDWLEERQAARS